jgi:hypothetical protein
MSIEYETLASLDLVSDSGVEDIEVRYRKKDPQNCLVTLRQGGKEIYLDSAQLRKLAVHSDDILEDIS